MATVQTFAVRDQMPTIYITSGAPLKPLRDDSVLRALSSLRGLRENKFVPQDLCVRNDAARSVFQEGGPSGATTRAIGGLPEELPVIRALSVTTTDVGVLTFSPTINTFF